MKVILASLLALGIALLIGNEAQASGTTYICKFEVGIVVIGDQSGDGARDVKLDGRTRSYISDEYKLVPQAAGLPTLLFQPELRRWKVLNERGETVEISVCRTAATS